ncbi:MAG: autoinducer binding domain-containing protein [Nitratireductor sp.]
MFNVKVFASFEASPTATQADRKFLAALASLRQTLAARHVNVTIYNNEPEQPSSVHVLTYPMDWVSHYIRNHYGELDPLLSLDYRRARHVDWQELYGEGHAAKMLASFVDAGMGRNGITTITPIGKQYYCGLSLVFDCVDADWPRFKAKNLELFRFEADRIGVLYLRIYNALPTKRIRLTQREQQVLLRVAQGQTDDEIAEQLGLGKWTVVGHLQSAKYKLGSTNRTSAVANAITHGIISLSRAV